MVVSRRRPVHCWHMPQLKWTDSKPTFITQTLTYSLWCTLWLCGDLWAWANPLHLCWPCRFITCFFPCPRVQDGSFSLAPWVFSSTNHWMLSMGSRHVGLTAAQRLGSSLTMAVMLFLQVWGLAVRVACYRNTYLNGRQHHGLEHRFIIQKSLD